VNREKALHLLSCCRWDKTVVVKNKALVECVGQKDYPAVEKLLCLPIDRIFKLI